MKKIFSLLFLFAVVGTFVSCKTTSNVLPPKTIETTNTIFQKEIVHDTVFEIKKDSSSYRALLECQNGKVVIKPSVKQNKGNYLEPPKVNLENNILTVDCNAEAQKMFAKWKDIYIHETSQTKATEPVFVEKPFTGWQTFQIWCGRVFIFLLSAGTLLVFLRWRALI